MVLKTKMAQWLEPYGRGGASRKRKSWNLTRLAVTAGVLGSLGGGPDLGIDRGLD